MISQKIVSKNDFGILKFPKFYILHAFNVWRLKIFDQNKKVRHVL